MLQHYVICNGIDQNAHQNVRFVTNMFTRRISKYLIGLEALKQILLMTQNDCFCTLKCNSYLHQAFFLATRLSRNPSRIL